MDDDGNRIAGYDRHPSSNGTAAMVAPELS
jgi:hypothetical protein